MKDTWVVMPAYNEELSIGPLIDEIKKYCLNLVVVDDGSTDRTYTVCMGRCYLVKHIINRGKGAALRSGTEYAIKNGAKNIIYIDSDGQHEPSCIPQFIEELESKQVIFGYRSFNKAMPFKFRFGNYVISKAIHLLFGIRIIDALCGFRALRADVYEKIKWHSDRYSVESEICCNVALAKLTFSQIPIETIYRDVQKGTTVMDGIKIMYDIFRFRREK